MLLIGFFMITVLLLCSSLYLLFHEREAKVKKRIGTFIGETQSNDKEIVRRNGKFLREKLGSLMDKSKVHFSKNLSSQEEEKLEKKLLQMGNPLSLTVAEFQLYIFLFKVCTPIAFGIFGKIANFGIGGIVGTFTFGLVIGLFLPNFYIDLKIKERHKKALKELPDFLDLLTVSLEAGLGFDLALNKVISKSNGILSAEFHTCLEEIRIGKTRREALAGVKERLNFDALKSLINSILQAEKLGMSMVQIFRIKSQEEREKRRQRAEEEAMKAPIKILFPLVLCIFPSIFIVILGPVVLQIMTSLGSK